jgi:hypothetical protein
VSSEHALPHRNLLPLPHLVSAPALARSFPNSISTTYRCGPCGVVGDALASSKRSGKSTGFLLATYTAAGQTNASPLARRATGRGVGGQTEARCGGSEARHWAHLHSANWVAPSRSSEVPLRCRIRGSSPLLTAALMPAEPHIRSPFSERLAPQSLILEVIGLERVGPHCISAYRSHCLRRPARPDPTRLIRPRGTRDSDFRFPGCLRLAS